MTVRCERSPGRTPCAAGRSATTRRSSTRRTGLTWQAQSAAPFVATLTSVSFSDAQNGWIAGRLTGAGCCVVLRTTDGGATWHLQGLPVIADDLYAGVQAMSSSAALATDSLELLATATGGQSSADTSSPSVAIKRPPGTWFNHAVTLRFVAADTGSGAEASYYSVDNAQTMQADSASLDPGLGQGLRTVAVAAIDAAGNGSKTVTTKIGIDTKAPTKTWTFNHPVVQRGKTATLVYRIYDPLPGCGKAKATILIYNFAGTRIVKRVSLGTVSENKTLSYRLRCTMTPGKYLWGVVATDIAHNPCSKKHEWYWRLTVK